MTSQWMPQINQTMCMSCGDCIAKCPTGALGNHLDKAALLYPELCTYCAVCEDICPVGAIKLPLLIVKDKQGQKTGNE